ncbi:MAG: alpha/beta hydrolase-fold protein [Opitutaceae bacterium]|nr:alpha/beta hydrolase-fold protein [Opitutaceae bacterium]
MRPPNLIVLSLAALLSFAATLAGQLSPPPAPPGPAAPPVTISRSAEHRIASAAVGDTFVVQVRLPASYESDAARFPVLYVLDADMSFGLAADTAGWLAWRKEIPELIVVGISYGGTQKDWWQKRSRDMTPTSDRKKVWGDFPLAGGATRFQDFLAQELFPLVESRHRARADDRTIVGLSFGGLFGIYTLFTRPELFQRSIIVAPALAWDERRILESEAQYRTRHATLSAIVFTAVGDRDDVARIVNPWHEFNRLIAERNYEGLRWMSHVFPGETHISVYPAAVARGLKRVYESTKPD